MQAISVVMGSFRRRKKGKRRVRRPAGSVVMGRFKRGRREGKKRIA